MCPGNVRPHARSLSVWCILLFGAGAHSVQHGLLVSVQHGVSFHSARGSFCLAPSGRTGRRVGAGTLRPRIIAVHLPHQCKYTSAVVISRANQLCRSCYPQRCSRWRRSCCCLLKPCSPPHGCLIAAALALRPPLLDDIVDRDLTRISPDVGRSVE